VSSRGGGRVSGGPLRAARGGMMMGPGPGGGPTWGGRDEGRQNGQMRDPVRVVVMLAGGKEADKGKT
jgi:hypothetical protein